MKKIIIANKKRTGLRTMLDLDGTISFWEKSVAKICNIDINDKKVREKLKNGKRMETFVGGDDKMWPLIDKEGEKFWTNMEILPWGRRLYNLLKETGDYFCFLTSPSNNPICASGKIKWLKKHFGENFKDFLIGRNKHLCASPTSILIDDNKDKIKKFKQFGGHVFQWPNPFKLIDGDVDINDIIKELKDFIKEIKNDNRFISK